MTQCLQRYISIKNRYTHVNLMNIFCIFCNLLTRAWLYCLLAHTRRGGAVCRVYHLFESVFLERRRHPYLGTQSTLNWKSVIHLRTWRRQNFRKKSASSWGPPLIVRDDNLTVSSMKQKKKQKDLFFKEDLEDWCREQLSSLSKKHLRSIHQGYKQ